MLTWLGIGAVIAVILVLRGFAQGTYAQIRSTVLDRGGQLIATQAGIANMLAARSVIPQLCRAQVESVPGVRAAHPLTALPVIYDQNGRKMPIFLFVYDTGGGPTHLIAGRPIERSPEIVIDRSLADNYGLEPGDDLTVSDFRFEIVGITDGAAALFTPFAFASYDALLDFYFESSLAADISAFPLISYLLVQLDPDADPTAVAQLIEERVDDVDVFAPEQIASNDQALGETLIGGILGVLNGVGYAAGVLVIALFMFTSAVSRRTDLGVLKAIGFSNGALLATMVLETSILTLAALPLAMGIAHAVAWGVHEAVPQYLVLPTETTVFLDTALASMGFALIGSLAPSWLIKNLEPAMVFRA